MPAPGLPRRRILTGAALAGAAALAGGFGARRAAAMPMAAAFPQGAALLVAGPATGRTAEWSRLLAPLLQKDLPLRTPLRQTLVGGADGVTAANQFEARTTPDGATALLLPGRAAMLWLVGDPRAKFDVAHWVPGLTGMGSGVIASRVAIAAMPPGAVVRMAASGPAGPELPGLLAAELLGLRLMPAFGITTDAERRDALAQGVVDAVFLGGRDVPQRLPALTALGAVPTLSMGMPDANGIWQRDAAFPDLPTLPEMWAHRGTGTAAALLPGWRAASAASQLDVALVLPHLTPAAMVALWRQACASATAAPELQAAASSIAVRPQAAPAANASTEALAVDAAALLAVRRWLTTRFNWRPV